MVRDRQKVGVADPTESDGPLVMTRGVWSLQTSTGAGGFTSNSLAGSPGAGAVLAKFTRPLSHPRKTAANGSVKAAALDSMSDRTSATVVASSRPLSDSAIWP